MVWTTLQCILTTLFCVLSHRQVCGLRKTVCEWDILDIACPKHQMILFLSANYGGRNSSVCRFRSSVPCVQPSTLATLNTYCWKRYRCELSVRSSIFQDPCQGLHKYLEVEYECVDKTRVTDVCSGTTMTSSSGVIHSPHAPDTYPPNKDCKLDVMLPDRLPITLRLLYINIDKPDSGPCRDSLTLTDNGQLAGAYCQPTLKDVKQVPARFWKLGIRFKSDAQKQATGFIVKYDVVNCGSLSNIQSGHVRHNYTTFNKEATYHCNYGYQLLGSSKRKCLYNGTWSGYPPKCTLKRCARPIPPRNGIMRPFDMDYRPGKNVHFVCTDGYKINGSSSLECKLGGIWSGMPPKCDAVMCGVKKAPENGKIDYPAYVKSAVQFGTTVNYTCNQGFVLTGSPAITCMKNGVWTSSRPWCKFVDCKQPKQIEFGNLKFTTTTYNSQVEYSCKGGYALAGSRVRVCSSIGNWSGVLPSCTFVDCKQPKRITNGVVKYQTTTYNSRAEYSCNVGYALIGPQIKVCSRDGKWNGILPVCIRLTTEKSTSVPTKQSTTQHLSTERHTTKTTIKTTEYRTTEAETTFFSTTAFDTTERRTSEVKSTKSQTSRKQETTPLQTKATTRVSTVLSTHRPTLPTTKRSLAPIPRTTPSRGRRTTKPTTTGTTASETAYGSSSVRSGLLAGIISGAVIMVGLTCLFIIMLVVFWNRRRKKTDENPKTPSSRKASAHWEDESAATSRESADWYEDGTTYAFAGSIKQKLANYNPRFGKSSTGARSMISQMKPESTITADNFTERRDSDVIEITDNVLYEGVQCYEQQTAYA